jgi:two-component system cell cycle sensor histidine kinase/response regulator CckA
VAAGASRSTANRAGAGEYRATIVVAEDEPALRRLVQRVLEDDGYRILLASNGREALELVEQHAEEIDLLITDVSMPQISGPDLVAQVNRRWPDLRVLYLSGHADSALSGGGVQVNLLRKPFELEELTRRVSETLEQPVPD